MAGPCDEIIRTHGTDRLGRRCLCATCGGVAVCTRDADYYTRGPGR